METIINKQLNNIKSSFQKKKIALSLINHANVILYAVSKLD